MSTLPPHDQKLLKAILEAGHRLEKTWPARPAGLDHLVALISAAADAESEELRRLSFHTRDLTPEMSAKHLSTILVPFERLVNRALRDDEFLVTSQDAGTTTARETLPLVLVADNIRSAFNVGALLRTGEAFGAERVLLTGYTPTPDDEKTARTSMGTQDHISWETHSHAIEAIASYRAEGYKVVALETAADAKELGQFEWPEKSLLLLGNERFGLDRELLSQADHVVRIPLHGRKNSLNVGIACGIALADWRRSRATEAAAAPKPIGVFRSNAQHPYEARRQASEDVSGEIATIELEPGQQFEQALKGIDGFERIWVVYKFHQNSGWKPMVLPPRGPRVKQGVFATRSPYRPSGLGISCVELLKVEGLKLSVRQADLLDGTPVYDLKPYIPYADSFPGSRAGWTEGLETEKFEVRLDIEDDLLWLEEAGVTQLRGFLKAQLEFDPLDDERKRVTSLGDTHCLAYRTWRAEFQMNDRVITVTRLFSGYSKEDLAEGSDDRYNDKDVHRRFGRRNN